MPLLCNDAPRPSASSALNKSGFPLLVDLGYAFPTQPCILRGLRLKPEKVAKENQICASGSSKWGSSPVRCKHSTPSFRRPLQVELAAKNTTTLTTGTSGADFSKEWFRGNRNRIAVLALAWAYILSARWAETLPGICSVAYGRECAAVYDSLSEKEDAIVVDIGNAGPDQARWWAFILMPGQGWCATMTFGNETFVSPWSIRLESDQRFVLSSSTKAVSSFPPFPPAPSFSDASRFITRFCLRHGIADQSRAALAAVLLFPCMGRGQTLQLPIAPAVVGYCYTRGLRPMLLSVFYEPSIECNAVSAWLQGSLAAISERARHAPLVQGRMLMDRSPEVSLLWLGVTVLGLQKDLLKEVGRGHVPIDLHAAAWSGTTQTFLQLPTSRLPRRIHRHTRLPLAQWKPCGSTPLEDTDLEVRNHAGCEGHRLWYQGFEWDVRQGFADDAGRPHTRLPALLCDSINMLSWLFTKIQRAVRLIFSPWWCCVRENIVCYEGMDYQRQTISENATRNIFTWLRPDGCARHEKGIWGYEWFDGWDSDDEVEESDSSDAPKRSVSSRVNSWLTCLTSELV
ncbi:hypothetical protein B0H63DRAFT_503369 [Podospora didyma]|uniref:Uncharacterized protein n=1 Tax=Podospora didyma TaxID=330526 RepID=A0AAE0K847_9PEZI|nr:hypothetical protein B0H63DRAFT_503369 [Podospora didyma]